MSVGILGPSPPLFVHLLAFLSNKKKEANYRSSFLSARRYSWAGSMLADLSRATVTSYGLHYAGCATGFSCAHADPNHVNEDTRHFVFHNISDSGGADPTAASLAACNPGGCYPHGINLAYKDAVEHAAADNTDFGTHPLDQTVICQL